MATIEVIPQTSLFVIEEGSFPFEDTTSVVNWLGGDIPLQKTFKQNSKIIVGVEYCKLATGDQAVAELTIDVTPPTTNFNSIKVNVQIPFIHGRVVYKVVFRYAVIGEVFP